MMNRPLTAEGCGTPYEKPQIKRVMLALEETLSVNCKVNEPESRCAPGGGTPQEFGS